MSPLKRQCSRQIIGRWKELPLLFVFIVVSRCIHPCGCLAPPLRSLSKPRRAKSHNSRIETSRYDKSSPEPSQRQRQHVPATANLVQHMRRHGWDGDDLRWWRRWRRRLQRRASFGDAMSATPIRTSLLVTSLLLFLYQTVSTVNFIRRAYPEYWPHQAIPILFDSLFGSSVRGPLTMDFAFSNALSQNQPHRFLTSGFFHGGLLPLLLNVDHLRRQPSWLETGLGGSLYLTTLLICIVTGNLGQLYFGNGPYDKALCLGLSGGISGLYGLMYVCLLKMSNQGALGRILKGVVILFLSGLFFDSVSNAAHLGGFLGGIVIGILCGPQYRKSYTMRRKNSVEYDPTPRDYRQVMGFGTMPTERGWIPVPLLWWVIIVALAGLVATNPIRFGSMPQIMLKGLLHPGSVLR